MEYLKNEFIKYILTCNNLLSKLLVAKRITNLISLIKLGSFEIFSYQLAIKVCTIFDNN